MLEYKEAFPLVNHTVSTISPNIPGLPRQTPVSPGRGGDKTFFNQLIKIWRLKSTVQLSRSTVQLPSKTSRFLVEFR
jgi:hypothetical protein